MSKLLRTLELRVVITVGVSLLLLLAVALGAWRPAGSRLERVENERANAAQRLADGQNLVKAAADLGLNDASEVAEAVRALESAIPETVDDLDLTRRVSSSAIVNSLVFEQWEALEPVQLDNNVSVVPYRFRVRGELSGINGFIDNLSTVAGHPVTYRDIRIDGSSGEGLVFGVDLVAAGVADIWIYTGQRVVVGSADVELEDTDAPPLVAPEVPETFEPESPPEGENGEGPPEQDGDEEDEEEAQLGEVAETPAS